MRRNETREQKKERKEMLRRIHTLRWRLTLFVFGILIISSGLTGLLAALMWVMFGRTPLVLAIVFNPLFLSVVLLCVCALFGTLLAVFLGKYYLRPLKQLSDATKEVQLGNYKVQVKGDAEDDTEMGELIRNFNAMVKELDGIELFRNDFINNFSHEFKTPIVSIRGFARELQVGSLSEEQRQEYVKIILEESDRLARLSTSVLELSRLENQQIVSGKAEFDLDEQLRQCILLQEPTWSEKGIEIIPELEPIRFFGNEEMLARVWSNLINNAIKFTPSGGTVWVTLCKEGGNACVQVKDTGIGMSRDVIEHIFEKFYQGDPSHHRAGYGIGLAMVHRAVMLCRGTITVTSEIGKGSAFTVRLPLKE